MSRTLTTRAATAVATLPTNLTGSPRYHAVQTIRRSYLADKLPIPLTADMLAAVETAMNRAAAEVTR